MPSTSNYGWPTPADTALVRDGADAIRDLGDAIDTTVKANADAAINKTFIAAKGDLIAATANDTPAILSVGADGFVLTASAAAATGLVWQAAQSGGGGVGKSTYNEQIFTTSGTFTPATGIVSVEVEMAGGGGGGGGSSSTAADRRGGGGGGGGEYVRKFVTVTPGTGVTVTIGAGGTAGTPGVSGGTGGTTSFGALNAVGGGGGSYGAPSGGIAGLSGACGGGSGGLATGSVWASGGGGGGMASPGTDALLNVATADYRPGGRGTVGGAGGKGTNANAQVGGNGGNGINGYCGGGGGGGSSGNGAAGGAGASGGGNGNQAAAGDNGTANTGG